MYSLMRLHDFPSNIKTQNIITYYLSFNSPFPLYFAEITNHDEYSLIRELPEAEKEKTLTLRRRGEKKMDDMKRKYHTDECKHFGFSYILGYVSNGKPYFVRF